MGRRAARVARIAEGCLPWAFFGYSYVRLYPLGSLLLLFLLLLLLLWTVSRRSGSLMALSDVAVQKTPPFADVLIRDTPSATPLQIF